MRREWVCAIVVACAAVTARADDTPAKPAKVETYEAVRAEYDAAKKAFGEASKKRSAEYQAALKGAESKEDKAEVTKKHQEIARNNPSPLPAFAPRFLAVARADSKSKDAPAALELALTLSGNLSAKGNIFPQVFETIREGGYLMRPEVQPMLKMLVRSGNADALQFVRDVIAKNPDRKTQAVAVKTLAAHYEMPAKTAERLTKSEQTRTAAEERLGKEKVEEQIAKGKEAKVHFDELTALLKEKYADVFPDLSVGKMAPEVVSRDLNGKEVKLSDLKGKVVVLDFWATWCGPCKAMIPHQREVVEKNKDKPFVLVSISFDAEAETVTEFLEKTKMPWTHWWNGAQGGLVDAWSVQGYPTFYVLDATGKIRYTGLGGGKNREKEIDEMVEKLVEEAQAAKK